jgi:hypothetical protein
MPGIEDFRKRAKQMTEKARQHGREEKKAGKVDEGPESPAERAKLRDAEEAEAPEKDAERLEDLKKRRNDEI